MKVNLGGISLSNGFILDDSKGRKVKSEKYNEVIQDMKLIGIFFSFLISIVLANRSNDALSWFSLIPIFIVNSFCLYRMKNQLAEWHGAEHKLVHLIIYGYAVGTGNISLLEARLTLENLRKQPISHYNCGSRNLVLREPSEEKLREALRMGQEYLKLLRLDGEV